MTAIIDSPLTELADTDDVPTWEVSFTVTERVTYTFQEIDAAGPLAALAAAQEEQETHGWPDVCDVQTETVELAEACRTWPLPAAADDVPWDYSVTLQAGTATGGTRPVIRRPGFTNSGMAMGWALDQVGVDTGRLREQAVTVAGDPLWDAYVLGADGTVEGFVITRANATTGAADDGWALASGRIVATGGDR